MTFRAILQQRAKKNQATRAIKKFSPYDIILAPIVTEKSYKQLDSVHKYVFKIHADANKNDVKQAIQFLYKVVPLKINLIVVARKGRQQRAVVRKEYKKAIVTLSKKDKIELGV